MDQDNTVINVTNTYLPPLEEHIQYPQRSWLADWVINRESPVKELAAQPNEYLAVQQVSLVRDRPVALSITSAGVGPRRETVPLATRSSSCGRVHLRTEKRPS